MQLSENISVPSETLEKITIFMKLTGMFDDPEAVGKQGLQLQEEMQELEDALAVIDTVEVADGIGDVLFVITTLKLLESDSIADFMKDFERVLNFNFMPNVVDNSQANNVFLTILDIVSASNLSKFDITEEEAENTVIAYAELGVVSSYKKIAGHYRTSSSMEQKDKSGKVFYAGKILKSKSNFEEPDLSMLVPMVDELLAI